MTVVKTYQLPPTALVPNSPRPLIHYPALISARELSNSSQQHCSAADVHRLLAKNGWQVQWIFRYGKTQASHYHSRVHECMVVLSGQATIRFGIADGEDHSSSSNGIEVQANVGDVFILPAGTAHKTFNTRPETDFKLLTPGDGHGIPANGHEDVVEDVAGLLEKIPLDGFTMIGAYPADTGDAWDFCEGGEDIGGFERVWSIERPELDPILGGDAQGMVGLWD